VNGRFATNKVVLELTLSAGGARGGLGSLFFFGFSSPAGAAGALTTGAALFSPGMAGLMLPFLLFFLGRVAFLLAEGPFSSTATGATAGADG